MVPPLAAAASGFRQRVPLRFTRDDSNAPPWYLDAITEPLGRDAASRPDPDVNDATFDSDFQNTMRATLAYTTIEAAVVISNTTVREKTVNRSMVGRIANLELLYLAGGIMWPHEKLDIESQDGGPRASSYLLPVSAADFITAQWARWRTMSPVLPADGRAQDRPLGVGATWCSTAG